MNYYFVQKCVFFSFSLVLCTQDCNCHSKKKRIKHYKRYKNNGMPCGMYFTLSCCTPSKIPHKLHWLFLINAVDLFYPSWAFIVQASAWLHYSLQLIEFYYLISALVSLEKDWCCSCCLVMQSTLSEGLHLIYSLTEHISRGRAHLTVSSVNSAYFRDSMMFCEFPPH